MAETIELQFELQARAQELEVMRENLAQELQSVQKEPGSNRVLRVADSLCGAGIRKQICCGISFFAVLKILKGGRLGTSALFSACLCVSVC